MDHYASAPLHIAINVTSASMVAVERPEQMRLNANIARLAGTFETIWAIDRLDDSRLPEAAQGGEVARFAGWSVFGTRGRPALLDQAATFILSGLEADLHVAGTMLTALDAQKHVIIARDAIWSPFPSAIEQFEDRIQHTFGSRIRLLNTVDLAPALEEVASYRRVA